MTPPAPSATSPVMAATLLSLTGTTTICSARRVTLQVASWVCVRQTGTEAVGVATVPADVAPVAAPDGGGEPSHAARSIVSAAATTIRTRRDDCPRVTTAPPHPRPAPALMTI